MEQGSLSDSCYFSLTEEERGSLSRIREHYSRISIFKFDVARASVLVDCSYEAMGKLYRDRINRETKKFGRYAGPLDGVFLMIADALRLYEESFCFFGTPKEASDTHTLHKKKVAVSRKKLISGFNDVKSVINEMLPAVWFKPGSDGLNDSLKALNDIQLFVDDQLNMIDFDSRSFSAAESFVNGVCSFLVWNANIKPTKPITDSQEKTPLLRFLEVFYPVEARSVLAKVYERERRLPHGQKIGSTFIPPL